MSDWLKNSGAVGQKGQIGPNGSNQKIYTIGTFVFCTCCNKFDMIPSTVIGDVCRYCSTEFLEKIYPAQCPIGTALIWNEEEL